MQTYSNNKVTRIRLELSALAAANFKKTEWVH
jgi:hypothetical protein